VVQLGSHGKEFPQLTRTWQIIARLCLSVGGLGVLYGLVFLAPSPPSIPLGAGTGGPAESLLPTETTAMLALEDSLEAASRVTPTGVEVLIQRNQSFYDAMRAHSAPHEDIMALVKACKPYRNLRNVQHGDLFRLVSFPDGRIKNLSFDLDIESYLVFTQEGDGYRVLERNYPVEHRISAVSGAIQNSLYASLKTAGAPLSLASKMNDILGWEIDFQRDLRLGDTYRIIYEEIWKQGEFVRTGPILALECVNKSRQYRAFRFVDDEGRPGYYTGDGSNLQKQLLRAPLAYSRISSRFSWRRLHPILKRYMPHLGVDYAAPVGTPVRAAGDGKVVEMNRKRGNGRYLKIRHTNSTYESYYLHLSRYAPGIKIGKKVRQGQLIGYVGASGYATGPHLDYRIKKNGVFVNPRKVKLPPAEPVAEGNRDAFVALTERYNRTLDYLPGESAPHPIFLARPAPLVTLWEPPPSAEEPPLTGAPVAGEP